MQSKGTVVVHLGILLPCARKTAAVETIQRACSGRRSQHVPLFSPLGAHEEIAEPTELVGVDASHLRGAQDAVAGDEILRKRRHRPLDDALHLGDRVFHCLLDGVAGAADHPPPHRLRNVPQPLLQRRRHRFLRLSSPEDLASRVLPHQLHFRGRPLLARKSKEL